ncbi:hypothetical protein M409DRAFT_62084 [Zasmidium cellare ATCC 36951]|uniref:Helicase C-terminal domain-containing protein n=1 Tax=Zasmidium cellare ATCC 36951 TaxID=1080233 RepID=A0A6A6D365_ZASCE|nr:uncharacterized protein M409DRAFT_62084 [Zasmidium cellare ATCC 36951]KAF2173847.1 hypothetical protein M409DRAFT_62084 [Zasmidium cellare ATCC 36951]
MRQRNLFEVMDLSKSDSDEDTIVVSHATTASRSKRPRGSDVSTTNARPRKVARLKTAPQSKAKPLRSGRSQGSVPATKAPFSSQSPRLTQSSPVTAPRTVLGEVSPSQFQNRLRGPIACESEDELAGHVRSTSVKKRATNTLKAAASKTRTKSRRKDSDDSDFSAESAASDEEESDDGDVAMDDSSSVQASESDEQDVVRPKKASKARAKLPAKAKATTTTAASTVAKPRASAKDMVNLLRGSKGLDLSLPPVSSIQDIFQDLTSKANAHGLDQAIEHLRKSRPLRVATMCSGTESPLLALEMIKSALGPQAFEIEHLFSAELVPFKQAYIERNFSPPLIFRDITELINAFEDNEGQPAATTAYGAKVPVPTDIDVLIAGTSCVDYSGMNSRKKGINDGGESGDTWRAVMDFCMAARPAIVLLENVKGAPWDYQLQEYQDIGYETVGALVNTKDYYIPHIRQRGYMACFDKQKLKTGSSRAVASQWAELMETFKRPASSPVSSFFLPNDKIARQHIRTDDPTREVDWSTCEIRHIQYRQQLRLGNARPITNWSASGSLLVPDNGNLQWYQRQVERVLDTIDVGNLRKALPSLGMYDNRYKTRVVDLSQNVDRDRDHRPFGVVGCITPSGMFYISDAGRPLTAEETLQLQGLPLDRISFTTESPSDVQDLAGNAMSTTVIGSSILSALIAGYKMIPQASAAERDLESSVSNGLEPQLMASDDMSITGFKSGLGVTSTADVLLRAARSLRKCYCEGPKGVTSRSLQECSDCGHTTCVACGGNPPHSYRNVSSISSDARLAPGQFEQELREVLPLRLSFDNNDVSVDEMLGNAIDPEYSGQVSEALKQTFSFQHVRRTHCWSVLYQSDSASLELAIENEANAEWRLFAHASSDLPSDSKLRGLLQQPVARSKMRGDFLASKWQVRSPMPTKVPIVVKASGSGLASWWARNELPDFLDHSVWQTLTIKAENAGISNDPAVESVCGVYDHLPLCGTACNGLYKKAGHGRPIYMFLDPTRIGDPKEDCFVFSHNKAILEYDEVRPVIARIDSSWRPWSEKEKEKGRIPATTRANLIVDDDWLPSDFKLSSTDTSLEICAPNQPALIGETLDCATTPILVSCRLAAGDAGAISMQPHQPGFFEKHGWIFEALRRHLPPEQWLPLQNDYVDCHCNKCAPRRPEIRWALSDNSNIVAQEDPATAAAYERAIKSRPEPLLVTVVDGREIQVGINITSLGHRAGARLRHDCRPEATISYVWRFTTGAKQADSFIFKPFVLLSTGDVEPFSSDCGLTVTLFPKQRLALAWMRKQEQGVDFLLEEVEESSLTALGWQAEVKARTTLTVKGGICADHPGFGKTILSLALVQSEWIEKSKAGILNEAKGSQSAVVGLIPIAATLIVCPAALLKQWQSEVVEKLRVKRQVIAINTIKDLDKHTISDFENATIIVVNRNVFGADAYAERLATFAGVPGPATKSGRSFAHWLKSIAQDVPTHVDILDRGFGLKKLQRHLKDVYKANLDSDKFKMSVPSRRLRGREYVAGKEKKKVGVETTAAAPDIDVSQVGKPLLEMFCFNRIMVDEFHQYEPKERAAIAGLNADKRWGLSATPAMDDFYDIAQTASLLGIPLRTSSGARGVLKTKNARDMKKEMTSFEQFDLMRDLPSDSMHAHIHATDQRFLDTFVRRNISDFNEHLVCFEHLHPVRLDVSHMALYAEISQHLNSSDMRIKKSTKGKATDRQERFHSVTNDCLTAEEALSKAAAFLDGDERDIDEIINRRNRQAEKILGELAEALHTASSEEPAAFASWKASRLDDGRLGDRDTIREVSHLLRSSMTVAKKGKAHAKVKSDSDGDSADPEDHDAKVSFAGQKEKTAKLNAMCEKLLKARRSARYLHNVKRIQEAAKKGEEKEDLCDNPECGSRSLQSEAAGVSVFCGHLICYACYLRMREQGSATCPADDCSESMPDTYLLWSQKMGDMSSPQTMHGAKAEAATKLLHQIEKQGDQAILFVQYEQQLYEIEAALQDEDISNTVVKNGLAAGRQVEQFVKSAGKEDQITVMVLNASDETAAGLNLQNANHVIFLSPLLRDSQYGYDSTMAQAIGRVRRYGQKKEIHVHRIFALDAIDVDILEHRERRNTALTERGGPSVVPPKAAKELDQHGLEKKEKTQLVCEDGMFSLRPQSWLVRCGADDDIDEVNKVKGKNRVLGWEDYSSLVKFSKTFTEDDDW